MSESDDTIELSPIREAITSVLTLPSNKVDELLGQLVNAGVETVEDLKFVTAEDLGSIKAIQCRKLLKAWSTVADVTDTSDQPLPVSEADDSSLNISEDSSTSSREASIGKQGNWANSFKIQWNKMSKSLNNSLSKNKRPAPKDRREMIRIICSDIIDIDSNPGRKNLAIIADQIVSTYPKSFIDDIGSVVIGDGSASILRQLENRINNVRRPVPPSSLPSSSEDEQLEPKPKRVNPRDSYGCINWQPKELPPGEDQTTQKERATTLKEMYLSDRTDWDRKTILSHMEALYPTIRSLINSKRKPMDALVDEYPFLTEEDAMMNHFEKLVGVNLKPTLQDSLEGKGKRILEYLKSATCPSAVKEPLREAFNELKDAKVATKDCSPELPGLVLLLTKYFGEDAGCMMILSKETNTAEEVAATVPDPSPYIIVFGPTLLTGKHYQVVADRIVISSRIRDFVTALAFLFASYYNYNIKYPLQGSITMEFIQRCFVGLSPKSSRKSKSTSGVHPRVLSLLKNMKDFENEWDL